MDHQAEGGLVDCSPTFANQPHEAHTGHLFVGHTKERFSRPFLVAAPLQVFSSLAIWVPAQNLRNPHFLLWMPTKKQNIPDLQFWTPSWGATFEASSFPHLTSPVSCPGGK